MRISAKDWAMYVSRLSRLGKTAAGMMEEYIREHGSEEIDSISEIAFGLVTKYGEGAATLACEMYDALAKAQGAKVPPAVPAETAPFWENRVVMKGTTDAEKPAAVSRLVKRAAADTTVTNAIRDGAQFAWIPSGDSCAFCRVIASRGWQYASKRSLKKGHAEHIHANCDCQYTIRFDQTSTVEGYDPDRYREMYDSAEGSTPQEKINSMRRKLEGKGRGVVEDLTEYSDNGAVYKVDGRHVVLKYTNREKEVGEILSKDLGEKVYMVPKVFEPQGITTPDYLTESGMKYDLKEIFGNGKNTLSSAVQKKMRQSSRFIFDIKKECLFTDERIVQDITRIMSNPRTAFIKEVMVTRGNRMVMRIKKN